jgi:hypothetical protein
MRIVSTSPFKAASIAIGTGPSRLEIDLLSALLLKVVMLRIRSTSARRRESRGLPYG